MSSKLEIDLAAAEEAWEAFCKRAAEVLNGADQSGSELQVDGPWENGGVRIDPEAFFALFTGLD